MQQRQQKPQTWRELLSDLNNEEKKRIINILGIQGKTLDRWIRGQTSLPRPEHIRRLSYCLSIRDRGVFLKLVQSDPTFSKYSLDFALPVMKAEIPATFYSRVLEANYTNHGINRFIIACQLVLLQAVCQLDPSKLGLSIIILKCTVPYPKMKVRSLYHQFSFGTLPWNNVIEQKNFFVGKESIAGLAIKEARPIVEQDLHQSNRIDLLSVYGDTYTASVAAFPIQKEERIAGCFFVRSTQEGFFSAEQLTLIHEYQRLVATAIDDNEFCEPACINLLRMPSYEKQQVHLSSFHNRISQLVRYEHYAQNLAETEREVRRQIEAELIASKE